LFLFWIIGFVFERGKVSAKLMIFLAAFVGVCFLLSSTVFVGYFDMLLSRLGGSKNLSDFTTGRTDLWRQYLSAFRAEPKLLFFGNGYTKVLISDRGTHNTVLQAIFQFGLVGCVCLVAWGISFMRVLLSGIKVKRENLVHIGILLMGAIGPWMALDFLFFDEFFLIPLYVCVGIDFLTNKGDAKDS
jgi:O-antigen ligase